MNAVQKIQVRHQELLVKTLFDVRLDGSWTHIANEQLETASIYSLNLSAEQFKELITALDAPEAKLTMLQFAAISNHLEAKSARDLGLHLNAYADFMAANHQNVVKWNELNKQLAEQAKQEISEEEKMLKAASESHLKAEA